MEGLTKPSVSVRAFERLRERAIRSRKYAECVIHGFPKPHNLEGLSPEDVTLTHAEVETAELLLRTAVENYNRANAAAIPFESFASYKSKYGSPKQILWECISEDSRLVAMWCEMAMLHVSGLEEAAPSNVIVNQGEIILRDKFVTNSAVAVGPNVQVHAQDITLVTQSFIESMDAETLADELARLRASMRHEATRPEHDMAVAQVSQAEQAARNGDKTKVLEYLKSAGEWALDAATKIGVSVAAAAIKAAAGLDPR